MDKRDKLIAELAGAVAELEARSDVHRALLVELLAVIPDRSWLERLTAAADADERAHATPLAAAALRAELDEIAILVERRRALLGGQA